MPRRRRRFIPAHAGNSCRCSPAQGSPAVHPRACGEQRTAPAPSRRCSGSSPRMRGTEGDAGRPPAPRRFIPAHAGNSSAPHRTAISAAVHPRACGEQCRGEPDLRVRRGSSPRMRGTGSALRPQGPSRRFIPAHAGNSPARMGRIRAGGVHPRACGEQGRAHLNISDCAGSSPRMRGTVGKERGAGAGVRFIPAHAGNSRPAPV